MRIIYFVLGILMSVIGSIGVFVPVLPTTPFLLLALYFFTRSSKRAREWFMNTKLYKHHIHDFVSERAMRKKDKVRILSFASAMLVLAFVAINNIYVRIFILFLIVFKYYYFIFRIHTIKEHEVESS